MVEPIHATQLRDGLVDLGIAAGDVVAVHSSLRSIGRVEDGAEAVVDALVEVIGDEGTLVVPAFNYRPSDDGSVDLRVMPGQTGVIAESVRHRPAARRSDHPTHSLVSLGPLAEKLTDGHLRGRAMAPDSPFGRVAKAAGKVLLLGVGHTSNTMLHVAEELARLPKRQPEGPEVVRVTTVDGRILEHRLDSSPSCSAAFGAAEAPLRAAGLVQDGRVGGALCQILPAAGILQTMSHLLRDRPDALLCGWQRCRSCPAVRAALAA